jgi:hypothetical protein
MGMQNTKADNDKEWSKCRYQLLCIVVGGLMGCHGRHIRVWD